MVEGVLYGRAIFNETLGVACGRGGFVRREFTQRVYLARGKLDRMSVDESAKKTTSDDSVEMCVEDQF